MPCRLIINADDFGLTRGINRAVAELHQSGVVTSATLMATGPAFEDAVEVAKRNPGLGVGCHLVLVDGTPVSPPREVPTLLGPDRQHFRPSLAAFVRDLFSGRIDEGEVEREALAQVRKLQRAGIDVTHVDTHKHTHMFPQIARVLISLVNEISIASLRTPFEPGFARRASDASLLRRAQLALLNHFQPSFEKLAAQTLTSDGTLGMSATGTLTEPVLHRLCNRLPQEGVWELCCHPGYDDSDLDHIPTRLRSSRDAERLALLSAIPEMFSLPNPPQLIHYGNLRACGARQDISLFHPSAGRERN